MTPTQSGLRHLPMMAGIMIASIGTGQLVARTGKYAHLPEDRHRHHRVIGFLILTFMTQDKSVLVPGRSRCSSSGSASAS